MTMTRRRLAAGAAALSMTTVTALSLGACSSNLDWQCGTIGRPPINVQANLCERGTPGVKWYAADVNALEDDDISVVGLPLDDDYYERDTRKYKPTKSTRTVTKTVTPTTKTTTSKPTTKTTTSKSK